MSRIVKMTKFEFYKKGKCLVLVINNDYFFFKIPFLGENAFQGRLEIPLFVEDSDDKGNALHFYSFEINPHPTAKGLTITAFYEK